MVLDMGSELFLRKFWDQKYGLTYKDSNYSLTYSYLNIEFRISLCSIESVVERGCLALQSVVRRHRN